MWAGLSLLLALCLLPGGGTESEGEGTRCKQPPGWSIGEVEPMKEVLGQVTVVALLQASWLFCLVQASLLDGLRLKLEGQGLENVTYMVVNHQGEQAQRLHTLLRQKLSENITLYKQQPKQEDVWQTLAGEKDDFLIYDRCGRLTYHISLPYSILGTPYVENAIKETYCTRVCGDCTYESKEIPAECNRTVEAKPEGEEKPVTGRETTHGGHGHHHHGHGHNGNRHGHNGNRHSHDHHGERGMGRGHGRDHGAEQQHQHDTEGLQHGQAHGQLHVGQEHMGQQAVQLGQMPQEGQRGHIMQNPWVKGRSRWKAEHSWQWKEGSDLSPSSKASWCWHWRRLFGDGVSNEPIGLWHCDEALPASWQWQGLMGLRETWQWRSSLADWQQPQPVMWAWPLGVESWGWGLL